jgi:hypothetical protein
VLRIAISGAQFRYPQSAMIAGERFSPSGPYWTFAPLKPDIHSHIYCEATEPYVAHYNRIRDYLLVNYIYLSPAWIFAVIAISELSSYQFRAPYFISCSLAVFLEISISFCEITINCPLTIN